MKAKDRSEGEVSEMFAPAPVFEGQRPAPILLIITFFGGEGGPAPSAYVSFHTRG